MTTPTYRLLSASAGTGKTYQLVEAYAQAVLEQGLSPKEIVAITFTRKAAAELRTRIQKRLTEAGCPQNIIDELATAPIQNFHGLALQLLQQFGHEARYSAHSQVLGESREDFELFQRCCIDCWFGNVRAMSDGIIEYTQTSIVQGLEVSAADKTSSVAPSFEESIAKLAPYFSIESALPSALWHVLAQAREDGCNIEETLWAQYDGQALRLKLQHAIFELRSDLAAVLEQQSPKAKPQLRAFLDHPIPDLELSLVEWGAAWTAAGKLINRRAAYKSVYTPEYKKLLDTGVMQPAAAELCSTLRAPLCALAQGAWALYQERKHERALVDFADLLERAVGLLRHNAQAYTTLRKRFGMVLVDEAQDTNRLQREFVHLLCGLSAPHDSPVPLASLTVVGDRKQAIYTFRGADPAAFQLFTDDIRAQNGDEHTLAVSYRSRPELVDAINAFFERLFEGEYEALIPEPSRSREGGSAVIEQLVDAPFSGIAGATIEADATAALITHEVSKGPHVAGNFTILLRAMKYAPLYARALARVGIAALIGGGKGLYEQPEIIDTIALLVWLSDPYARLPAAIALRSPLIGLSDSMLLELCAGENKKALRELRMGLWTPKSRPNAGPQGAETNAQAYTDAHVLAWLKPVLVRLVAAAEVMPAAKLLEYMDSCMDIRASLIGLADGEQRVANFDRLVELAERFDRRSPGSAHAFALEQQARQRREHAEPVVPAAGGNKRAVIITTVHQSKGLEYPLVILADLYRRSGGDSACLRFDRELGIIMRPRGELSSLPSDLWEEAKQRQTAVEDDERCRLLYVAMTRAQNAVFIMARAPGVLNGEKPKKPPKGTFAELLQPWIEADAQHSNPLVERRACVSSALPSKEDAVQPLKGDAATETGACVHPWALPLVPSSLETPHVHNAPCCAKRIDLSVTALADFVHCPERGRLLHIVGEVEPALAADHSPASEDGRNIGSRAHIWGMAAHRVLAQLPAMPLSSETARAQYVDAHLKDAGIDFRDTQSTALRAHLISFLGSSLGTIVQNTSCGARRHELPFQLRIALEHGRYVMLHGQIDLVLAPAADGSGNDSLSVVDFKYATSSAYGVTHYEVQLDAYAAAVAEFTDYSGDISTQLVYLKDGAHFVRTVDSAARERFRHLVREVCVDIDQLTFNAQTTKVTPTSCRQTRCGFFGRCYGKEASTASVKPHEAPSISNRSVLRQLSLFD